MRKRFRPALIVIASLSFGCNPQGSSAPPQVMTGPHSGTTIRLPGDKGFVELSNDLTEGRDRGSRAPTAIVTYFLKPDGVSAMEPAVRREVGADCWDGEERK